MVAVPSPGGVVSAHLSSPDEPKSRSSVCASGRTPSIDHCSRWPRARSCRITTSPGTDVAFGLRGRGGHAGDGDLRRRGAFGNLPAGEAYIAPIESTGEGVSFGGANAAGVHIDGVIRAPTVELDGEPLLEDGRLAIHDRR
jgi:leucyl aminopeptidase (aminopeptidase T)